MSAIIRTRSGDMLDLLDPNPELIHIEDIAHALSVVPRFAGHTLFPYSVAQHSIWCYKHSMPGIGLQALMHDATEAYLHDITTPLKKNLARYQIIESFMWSTIAKKYGIAEILDEKVKSIDQKAFKHEYFWLKPDNWKPQSGLKYEHYNSVKKQFLELFERLTTSDCDRSKPPLAICSIN